MALLFQTVEQLENIIHYPLTTNFAYLRKEVVYGKASIQAKAIRASLYTGLFGRRHVGLLRLCGAGHNRQACRVQPYMKFYKALIFCIISLCYNE